MGTRDDEYDYLFKGRRILVSVLSSFLMTVASWFSWNARVLTLV